MICRGGGTGRRTGLKIPREQSHESSTLSRGTKHIVASSRRSRAWQNRVRFPHVGSTPTSGTYTVLQKLHSILSSVIFYLLYTTQKLSTDPLLTLLRICYYVYTKRYKLLPNRKTFQRRFFSFLYSILLKERRVRRSFVLSSHLFSSVRFFILLPLNNAPMIEI